MTSDLFHNANGVYQTKLEDTCLINLEKKYYLEQKFNRI